MKREFEFDQRVEQMCIRDRDKGEQIRQAAKMAGQSLQGYILQACSERMQRDGFTLPEALKGGESQNGDTI